MVVGIVIVAVLLIAVVSAAIVVGRRKSAVPAPEPAPQREPAPAPPPMASLEDALNRVTGSDGRPIGEAIDAEAAKVDDLRVPDDTGPLLRRALDHVEHDERDDAPAGDGDVTAN